MTVDSFVFHSDVFFVTCAISLSRVWTVIENIVFAEFGVQSAKMDSCVGEGVAGNEGLCIHTIRTHRVRQMDRSQFDHQ